MSSPPPGRRTTAIHKKPFMIFRRRRHNWTACRFVRRFFDLESRICNVFASCGWILLKAPLQQRNDCRRRQLRQRSPVRIGLEDASQDLATRLAFERLPAGQHLE